MNPATYMLYSIYPDDKVLIGSNKVIRTEFISQPRDRREKSISGQYISQRLLVRFSGPKKAPSSCTYLGPAQVMEVIIIDV